MLVEGGHVFAVTGAVLAGLGFYSFLVKRHPIRQLLAANVVGAGVFLMLGGLGRSPGGADPFAQALVITGIVIAVALSALGAAMVVRLAACGDKDEAPLGEKREGP